ncbi:MAG: endopeptidase La [Firmicutes bacterium]|nr:endopeptidase La [Bacillota bacterium]MDD4791482.1 endopeptidase La [Bacillota bacterium]
MARADKLSHKDTKTSAQTLPLLPLRGVVVFPHTTLPLEVGRDKSVVALEEAMSCGKLIVLAAQKVAKVNEPSPDDIYTVGTVSAIKQLVRLPDGTIRVVVEGVERAVILEYVHSDPCYVVKVEPMPTVEVHDPELEALARNALREFEQFVKLSKKIPVEILLAIAGSNQPGKLADDIAANMPLKIEDKQEILSCFDARTRLERLSVILRRELEILELERKIHMRVRKQMEKTQEEYYLREQMRAIKKELGDRDDFSSEAEEFKQKIEEANLPQDVLDKAVRELDKLESMPPMAAESVVVRNYLDWLLAIPWGVMTEDRLDIERAEEILDEDHWGLEKVKERILEFLAVRQLSDELRGPILCLVGPPGVGKTSLGKSVARALNRNFVRFSLGGVRDEAEIRGHRRTYVGAMPGKVVQLLRQAGSMNPVILLDEIDKMSADFRGDPSSALLEVLDPEQNCEFGDHYMEVTIDLSNVMFITTANNLYSIPRPLQDRMEIIRLPGYTEEDKLQIARHFLVSKQLAENGLLEENVVVEGDAVREIIRCYTRESGVRNLERQIGSIFRKIAREVVGGSKGPFVVNQADLQEYLGVPQYRYGVADLDSKVGVAVGVAWTETGGDTLDIEVSAMSGSGKLILTGKLGDVMRESAQAGYTYVRSRALELGISEDFYEKMDVHIHVPEGATPKDGPSAGITMATALASALSGTPVRNDLAMTGEITLRGRVLPVGGIKEKALAAHRAGIRTMIIPDENNKDLEELPENVACDMTFVEVSHMDEVLAMALLPSEADEEERLDACSSQQSESADESGGVVKGLPLPGTVPNRPQPPALC